jgi:hypothetical protein
MKRVELPLRVGKVVIIIDRPNNKTWKEFYNNKREKVDHRIDVYHLNEEWIHKLLHCKGCKQPISDERFAWAFWKLQPEYCSTTCFKKDKGHVVAPGSIISQSQTLKEKPDSSFKVYLQFEGGKTHRRSTPVENLANGHDHSEDDLGDVEGEF